MEKMAQGPSAKNKKGAHRTRLRQRGRRGSLSCAREVGGQRNAAAFRAGMISACRLVGFKMTLAKLSVFIEADGFDAKDVESRLSASMANPRYSRRTPGMQRALLMSGRARYRQWAANLRIRFDADQFQVSDVINLISRVGLQVGIGAGRPDSKSSSGCGWGMFRVVESDGAPGCGFEVWQTRRKGIIGAARRGKARHGKAGVARLGKAGWAR